MPTIIGSKSGTRPYLELDWSVKSQDIANNRSTLTLKLYLRVEYSIGYNARYTGVLQGSSFTSNAGYISSPGRYLLAQRDITVGHNSDGTKTVNFSASYNISISWGGTYYSSISLSGSGTLPTIPRGSTLSKFHFDANLKIGTENKIHYTVTRYSGNFRLQFQLRDGGVTISTWDNQSVNGDGTLTLPATAVNTLLNRMSTVTSKEFTLRVATRSGVNGGWIGSAVTRKSAVSVDSSVEPFIDSTSVVPVGNSWAVNQGIFLQGQTSVKAAFSANSRGGAGVRSRQISVGGSKGGSMISGATFQYTTPIRTDSGVVRVTYTITDTRGRTATTHRDIDIHAYQPPQINNFTAGRANPSSTSISINRVGVTHTVGGRVSATLKLTETRSDGNSKEVETTNFTGSFSANKSSSVSTAMSAEYTLTVTDTTGSSATATVTIGTAFMELSVRKGQGVGLGKVHERGSLDVDGEAFFEGPITITTESSDGNVTPITGQYMLETHTGVLIDVCDTTLNNMITIRITGNGYFSKPIFTILQAYHYNTLGDFREVRQTNFGDQVPRAWIFIQGGRIKVWVPRTERFQSFIVEAWGQGGRIYTTKTQSMSARPTNVTHAKEFDSFLPFKHSVNGKNMNDVLESGFYYGYTQTNSAVNTISGFLVINYSNDWITQLQFVPGDNADIYIRHKHGGTTWTNWVKK